MTPFVESMAGVTFHHEIAAHQRNGEHVPLIEADA
ncbi:hypothetical protein HD597_005175 [Nonomuraea thailandensis]|uniref:Uncharacterized protein n=1 Tax=Nonomuraea thailandensis TaxID=1188745 RepID=A0A9X2GHZ5_9ACTN|nr:hypothetical protein [Nonomuraea thailandensis]